MNAIATIEPQTRSVTTAMAHRYGMEPAAFEQTLRATVIPKDCSKEQFAAFLLVAKEYGLNPITKEIYAFPKQGGGIQPIVSVDGWANLINSNPNCDGFEFFDALDENGALVSVTCRIYRKDRKHPTEATEYMIECRRDTSTWKQWPRRMLRHKALIQAARYAFGFAGIVDPDEAERLEDGHYAGTTARLVPPPAPSSEAIPFKPEPEAADFETWLRTQYGNLENCKSENDLSDLREAVLSDLGDMPDECAAWKASCADRAAAIFKETSKK
jgi:phage recombination protein Bet